MVSEAMVKEKRGRLQVCNGDDRDGMKPWWVWFMVIEVVDLSGGLIGGAGSALFAGLRVMVVAEMQESTG
jgi:hypothetical protein